MKSLWLIPMVILSLSGACAAEVAPPPRPNVVYVIVDDLRWDCLGIAGHPHLLTPHMDLLARGGARMKESFVVTSLCSPSRASFLTGRYPHQHGIRHNHLKNGSNDLTRFENEERTFPQILHETGYATAYFGKFHIVPDGRPQRGFDTWMALPGQGQYIDPTYDVNGKKRKFQGHADDITGDHAAAWLKDPARKEKPFCLCVGFKAPHAPQTPPPRHARWLEGVEIPKPANYDEDYAAGGKPDVVAKSTLRIGVFPHGLEKKGGWDPFIKDFYRSIRGVDDNLGKILAALQETGLAQNTLVVFVGDNGFYLGEHHLIDKRFPYEEGLRVPMLIRCPGRIAPGTTPTQIALSIDIAPTILDFCGVGIPANVPGRSLSPILSGQEASDWRRDFFYEYAEPPPFYLREGEDKGNIPVPYIVAVRSQRHKYIEYLDAGGACELYDLAADPREMKNLAGDPAQAELLASMRARLAALQKELRWTPPPPPPPAREKR